MSKDQQLYQQIIRQKIQTAEQQIQRVATSDPNLADRLRQEVKTLQASLGKVEVGAASLSDGPALEMPALQRERPVFYCTAADAATKLKPYWVALCADQASIRCVLIQVFFPEDRGTVEFGVDQGRKLVIGKLSGLASTSPQAELLRAKAWRASDSMPGCFTVNFPMDKDQCPVELTKVLDWLLGEIYLLPPEQSVQVTLLR